MSLGRHGFGFSPATEGPKYLLGQIDRLLKPFDPCEPQKPGHAPAPSFTGDCDKKISKSEGKTLLAPESGSVVAKRPAEAHAEAGADKRPCSHGSLKLVIETFKRSSRGRAQPAGFLEELGDNDNVEILVGSVWVPGTIVQRHSSDGGVVVDVNYNGELDSMYVPAALFSRLRAVSALEEQQKKRGAFSSAVRMCDDTVAKTEVARSSPQPADEPDHLSTAQDMALAAQNMTPKTQDMEPEAQGVLSQFPRAISQQVGSEKNQATPTHIKLAAHDMEPEPKRSVMPDFSSNLNQGIAELPSCEGVGRMPPPLLAQPLMPPLNVPPHMAAFAASTFATSASMASYIAMMQTRSPGLSPSSLTSSSLGPFEYPHMPPKPPVSTKSSQAVKAKTQSALELPPSSFSAETQHTVDDLRAIVARIKERANFTEHTNVLCVTLICNQHLLEQVLHMPPSQIRYKETKGFTEGTTNVLLWQGTKHLKRKESRLYAAYSLIVVSPGMAELKPSQNTDETTELEPSQDADFKSTVTKRSHLTFGGREITFSGVFPGQMVTIQYGSDGQNGYKARRFRLYVNKEPAEPPKIGSAHLRVMSKPPLAAAEFAAAVTFEPGRAPEDTPAAAGTSLFGSSEEKTQAVAALHRTLVKYTPQSVLLALDLARSEVAQEIVAQDAAAKATAEAAAAAAKAAEEDSAASPEAQGSEQPSTGSVRAAARVAQV